MQSAVPSSIKLHLLNHASLRLDAGDVRLLMDPWFSGTAFAGGWGLKWENDAAWELAAAANVLWISHFHADHFHVPTLKRLATMNPDMTVLANDSFNFQFSPRLRQLGFKNVVVMHERTPITLADGVTVCRYPATGIDNMLHIRVGEMSILNLNDCVLSGLAKRLLKVKIGRIDLLLPNFNHAGKILVDPRPEDAKMRAILKSAFAANIAPFKARHTLPIASYHYYRAPESSAQNGSLLVAEELVEADPSVTPWRVGGSAELQANNMELTIREPGPAVHLAAVTTVERKIGPDLPGLGKAAEAFTAKLRSAWGPFARLIPPLVIDVTDLGVQVELNFRHGKLAPVTTTRAANIAAHSSALVDWWTSRFGTDSFMVGAHFALLPGGRRPLIRLIMAAMLMDNDLALRQLFRMVTRFSGLAFLFNRREEIVGIIVTRQITSEYQKQLPKAG